MPDKRRAGAALHSVAPKADGDFANAAWHKKYDDVLGAKSYCDGLANTAAMVANGSALAKKISALKIGGFTDWYLPALDELEITYRAFKPTTDENSQWGRSGINVSALPPTYPYTLTLPVQTLDPRFQKGGAEAFEASTYWTSTQHASDSGHAWGQHFCDGIQLYWLKDFNGRARAIRRLAIQ